MYIQSTFLWSELNQRIDELTATCQNCVLYKSSTVRTVLNIWDWAKEPFSPVHMLFLEPVKLPIDRFLTSFRWFST